MFEQAAALAQTAGRQKKHRGQSPKKIDSQGRREIEKTLHMLRSREDRERLLQDEAPSRQLETKEGCRGFTGSPLKSDQASGRGQ
jgi:hypothetical protein